MSGNKNSNEKLLFKVAITGGPCGGKTTGQDRLSTFFENLGWTVFRVPEVATVLLRGGVRFDQLSRGEAFTFQNDLLRCQFAVENVYWHLAETCQKNCVIICDRGTMDFSAYLCKEDWAKILNDQSLNEIDIRDNRYDQVVHLESAAIGAEKYYTLANNVARTEGLDEARYRNQLTKEAWLGHPYFDIIDNCGNSFDEKMTKLIQVVCDRAGVSYGDRFAPSTVKRKFLVKEFGEADFPSYQEFDVVHDYLFLKNQALNSSEVRIRKRGREGHWSYTHTVRRTVNGKRVETRMQLSVREYQALILTAIDPNRHTIYKKRRCFATNDTYFQLDIFIPPSPPRCIGLMLLETYTTKVGDELKLPEFLVIEKEVTHDPDYSMATLSAKQ